MNRRDEFAAQFMTAMIRTPGSYKAERPELLALGAVAYADALIKKLDETELRERNRESYG